MRRTMPGALAGAALWLITAALPAFAEPPNATAKSGEIRGRVTYCASAGASGAVVHLPGKSFEARVGPSGDFQLYWVPVGRHSVAIDAPGRATHVVEDVVVADRRITELAEIALCRDGDGDGANESVDCNDNNPNIRPGAAEACDGVDNNCDGVVDDGCATCSDSDGDGFFAQGHCGTPVDCDDTAATTRPGATEACDGIDNDCDTTVDEAFNLQSDPSNCGSCGIVCPARGFGNPAACASGACVNPLETCDHVDNDLDGQTDEGFDLGGPCVCPNPFFQGTRECSADGESTVCGGCP